MKVVKSNGKVENFNLRKLIDSLIATFEIARTPTGVSDDFIRKTIKDFHGWCLDKPEITSRDIRLKISEILHNLHPEAGYIYKNFENII